MTSKRISMLRNSSSLFALGAASALLTGGPAHAFDANSLPQGGNVTGGAATIATSGNTLTVNQSSNRAVIDWRSFDIGANAQANFNQPGASAIAVNRVNASTDPSRIEGGLHASGQVWILNPNGVMFGKTARVDAAGVVATTANIDDKAFMAGDNKLQMRGGDSGQVVNEGHITIGQGGMAAFVAPSVRNSGTIRARVGRVTLAAGDTYTLDLAGDRLVEIGLGAGKAVVDQSGKIVNEGGVITISAKAAGQAVDSLINMSGVLDASSVKTAGGKIVLGADTINIASAATLKADGTSGGQITVVADKTGNYAGSYSAQGSQGDGGQVETSGKAVHIDSKIAVNTSAPKGKTGSWTLDPNDLTVTAGNGGTITSGINTDAQSTVGADAVVAALASTNVTLQAKNSITVNSAIDASGNGVAHNLTLADQDGGGLTVNLNAAITLKSGGVLSGGATVVNLTNGALIQNGNDVALANSAINLNGGIYAPGATLSKSGLSLIGANGAEIDVNPGNNQVNAIAIAGNTDGVSVSGLVIRGEVTGSYVDYAFGSGMSRGVAVVNGATNFTISGNDIRNVRVGILIDGRNTGSITGNTIDNTKGAVLVQYTDAGVGNSQGYAINISGNHQGPTGNEWGIDTHLNGFWNGTAIVSYPGGAAPSGVQATLLASSAANDGWTVQDQAYTASNRTAVTVATTGSNANQGSARTPLATIQAGINAIVTGGTVNVKDGTYVVSAANGYTNGYLGIGKSLKLIGQSQAGVIIDARNASTYGIRVIGGTDSVSLSNFTLLGVAATNAYGIKVEDSTNFSIDHVTSKGAYKAQLDLNGVRGGTVSFVTADGTSNGVGAGSTKGAAIAITDSQNLTISNSSVIGGAYGGIGIYQSNKPSGYTYQTSNVTIDGSNTFNANGAAHYNYVYTEDESATNNFGTLTIAGFDYVAGQDSNSADTFKYFQRTQQGAIDYLDSIGAVNVGYVEGWTGSAVNNRFAVANATGGNAMAINPALTAAAAGATITVAPGVYAETLNITRNVDITGAGIGQTIIRPTTLLNTGVAHKYDANVKATVFVNGASNVNLSGLTIDGNNLGNNAVVFWNNASGSISNSRIVNPQAFNGAQTGQDLAVDATGSTTSNLTISGVQFANWNKNAIDVVTGGGSISGGGNVTLNVNNSSFAGQGATGLNAQNGIVLWERGGSGSTINATVDHSTFSGITYTGTDSNATGILLYGATTGSLTVKNSTFDNSVQNYIGTDGGSLVEINATTGNIFDGVAEGGATLDQLFNIENHLVDGTDNAGNSLVRLKSGQVYVTAAKNSIQNGVSAATAGDTVNVQAGTYAGGIAINTNGITLQGQSGTVIAAGGGSSSNAITVNGDNVTVRNLAINLAPTGGAQINGVGISGSADGATLTGLTIRGEVAGSYQDYAFGSAMSRGVYVQNGATNFAISGNDIRNVRVGILADGAANLGSSPTTPAASPATSSTTPRAAC
ncbi:MAG: filamentous hemagglutinin N-terminal protein [Alphaproteobacteria bacterium]|nr:filamentous hemagglutinin N-terminal protein [Alphaproteobacteria bacterium]